MVTNYEPPQIESYHPIPTALIGAIVGSGVPVASAAFRSAVYEPPRVESREPIQGGMVALISGLL
jgi:hypothetical protein